MNFNPFKKNDEKEFKLNEHDLPSLNDSPGIGKSSDFGISEPNLAGSSNSLGGLGSMNNSSSPPMPEPSYGSIDSWNDASSGKKPEMNNSNDGSTHNEISKSKLETIETKVTLIDTRLSSIEQKIELMYQLISSEVSEETKRKFKVNSMMKEIKGGN